MADLGSAPRRRLAPPGNYGHRRLHPPLLRCRTQIRLRAQNPPGIPNRNRAPRWRHSLAPYLAAGRLPARRHHARWTSPLRGGIPHSPIVCSRPLHGLHGWLRRRNSPLRSRTRPPLRRRTHNGRHDLPNRRRVGALHFLACRPTGNALAERPVRRTRRRNRKRRLAGRIPRGSGRCVLDLPLSAAPIRATDKSGRPECLSAPAHPRAAGPALPPVEPGRSRRSQSALPQFLCFENAADPRKTP